MRWFQRDSRVYIGPVTELQMDILRTRPVPSSSGIACQAADGKVEMYLTLPQGEVSSKVLEDIRMEAF